MRALYIVLMQLAGLILWPVLWLKGRRDPAWRGRVAERFGHVSAPAGGVAVWVHAVSVGEVMAAMPLIRALIARHGTEQVCVTTTTPTGSAQVRAQLGDQVLHCYAPIDMHSAVNRFLDRLRPRQVVIMETELWPTLFRQLKRRGIPLMIANARLSPRSVRGYGRVAGFARSVMSDITLVAAQSEADAERYRQLGAPRVANLGNLKFDVVPDAEQVNEGRTIKAQWGTRPVWIAASTHEGEETAAIAAHRQLLATWPDAVLVLVPRHPPRFKSVADELQASGLNWARRSETGFPDTPPSVLLGDSMGEMWRYLALADVAFVGGSLVPVGGHNVLEPAALGLPVLFGPHMHNFEASRDLLTTAGSASVVADASALSVALSAAFTAPAEAITRGRQGQKAMATNAGALARTVAHILDLTSRPHPP